ncbi:hypothetical protein J4216_06245 [Candidatus Woesearchaeota archaeon]|nr:hypothetical protein [Candidatus Woesearchaeota archaeon]
MKKKISISIDEKTIELVDKILNEGTFRNKSHLIEYSVKKFLEEKKE